MSGNRMLSAKMLFFFKQSFLLLSIIAERSEAVLGACHCDIEENEIADEFGRMGSGPACRYQIQCEWHRMKKSAVQLMKLKYQVACSLKKFVTVPRCQTPKNY
jgi:hypothetical protein